MLGDCLRGGDVRVRVRATRSARRVRLAMAGRGGDSVNGGELPQLVGVVHAAVGAPAKEVSAREAVSEHLDGTAPPKKKARKWHGVSADLLCVKAVTTAGAHLAEWGKGEKMYDKAASLFNEQPGRPFDTDAKNIKDHFQLVVKKFEKKDKSEATLSGISVEQTELDEVLSLAASAMADSNSKADAAKGEQAKKDEALQRAGEAVRSAAQARRSARRAAAAAAEDASEEGGDASDAGDKGSPAGKASPAVVRRRRRDEEEDEKDQAILDLIERSAKDKQAAEDRRCAAEERRLVLEEKRLENEQRAREEAAEQAAARHATDSAALAKTAADAVAAAAADRLERAKTMELLAALVRRLDK